MNTSINLTDDPRLTAYALGELKGTERDEIERLVARSPAAKAEVEAIRELAGALTYELAGELPRAKGAAAPSVARSEQGRDGRGNRSGTSRLRRRLSIAATAAVIVVAVTIAARHDFAVTSKRQSNQSDQAVGRGRASVAPRSADVPKQLVADAAKESSVPTGDPAPNSAAATANASGN